MTNETLNQLPEHVRQNLKNYKMHRQVTCLECGYIGLMGIDNPKVVTVMFWVAMGLLSYFLVSIGFNIFMTFFILVAAFFIKKMIFADTVICPSCSKKLRVK